MWALFAGLSLLMLGNGLQGALLGLRGTLSGFSTDVTGAVMACYYVGYLIGAWTTPRMIRRVGHVRLFTALAALISFVPLAHSLFVSPLVWALLRMLAGIGMVGIFIICESWLNSEASNSNRGRLLSVYIIVCQISQVCAQMLLGLADPMGFELFVLISALCTLAVIPMALGNHDAPRFENAVSMPFAVLRRRVPMSLLGLLMLISMTYGSFYAIGSVYALKIGLEPSQVGKFMAVTLLGSISMQWPLGMLSDHMDRRRLIMLLCAGVSGDALLLALVPAQADWLLYVLMFVYGGLSFPIYSIIGALIGDSLRGDEMVSASSRILLMNGVGSALGPLLVSQLMSRTDVVAYPLFIAIVHVGVAALLYRLIGRTPYSRRVDATHHTTVMPQSSEVVTGMSGRIAGEV